MSFKIVETRFLSKKGGTMLHKICVKSLFVNTMLLTTVSKTCVFSK